MRALKVGDVVTCKNPTEAYHSGRYFVPLCWLMPGDIGVISEVGVYCETHGEYKGIEFCRAEFFQHRGAYYYCSHEDDISCSIEPWTVRLDYDNIILQEIT